MVQYSNDSEKDDLVYDIQFDEVNHSHGTERKVIETNTVVEN